MQIECEPSDVLTTTDKANLLGAGGKISCYIQSPATAAFIIAELKPLLFSENWEKMDLTSLKS